MTERRNLHDVFTKWLETHKLREPDNFKSRIHEHGVVYLRCVQSLDGKVMWYVGETHDLNKRYSSDKRAEVVLSIPVVGYEKRLILEDEVIEFCQAFGLPLLNKRVLVPVQS